MRSGEPEAFYAEDMEILNGGMDDEAVLFGKPIVVSVFPAVYKKGDSFAEILKIRSMIKGVVFCKRGVMVWNRMVGSVL